MPPIADTPATVLVVEDNPINLKLVQAALRRSFRVLAALNAAEALRVLSEETPDLILMDIGLPGMNGLELTRELRRRPEFKSPVVALTAHAMPSDREAAIEAGCDAFISKPFDTRALANDIAALIRGAAASD